MNGKYFVGKRVASFEKFNPESPVTGVRLLLDDENGFESGDMDGNVWEMENPYATQAMADNILAALKGKTYTGFEASAAPLGLEAELGDGVTVNGLYSVLAYQNTTFGPGHMSNIAAPGDDEPEEEYKYVPAKQREETRRLGKVRSYITKTASQIQAMVEEEITGLSSSITVELQSITSQVNGLDGRVSTVEQTAEGLTSSVNGLDGQFTEFKQTVEGISSTVTGLGGEFSELQQTIEGLAVSGPGGSTLIKGSSIETGSLQLTGLITWGDLDDDVSYTLERSRTNTFTTQPVGPYYVGDLWYKDDGTVWRCKIDEEREGRFYDTDWEQIQDAGLTEDIVHTLITGDLVESPTIRGAQIYGGDIYGGAYHDEDGDVYFELTGQRNLGGAGLRMMDGARTNTMFSITPGYSGSALETVGLSLFNNEIFSVGRYGDVTVQRHDWTWAGGSITFGIGVFQCSVDFSNATVTGLTAVFA